MADALGVEQPDLSGAGMSPTHKRKRGSESASPDSRRSKRGAPTAVMTEPDATTAAFIENAVNAAHAAAQEHVNVEDFSALQQAAADHSEAADPANASSTAAAALGSMYPTLHVPQSTEETFVPQPGPEVDHQPDTSFNNSNVSRSDGLPNPPAPMQHPNGVQEPRYTGPPNPKPAVGSEEWHKMRKDNHKEGTTCSSSDPEILGYWHRLTHAFQSSVVAVRP